MGKIERLLTQWLGEAASASGKGIGSWPSDDPRWIALDLNAENAALRARLAEVEAERDAARDAGMESLADKIGAGLSKYGYEEQEGDEPEKDVVRSIVALIEERAEAAEAEVERMENRMLHRGDLPLREENAALTERIEELKRDRDQCRDMLHAEWGKSAALLAKVEKMRGALVDWLNAPWTSATVRPGEPPCLSREVWHHRMNQSRDALSPAPTTPTKEK